MRFRILFFMVTAFFVTMNVLLWRSEFGGRSRLGTLMPADVVWEKVLTCPDNSFLEIRHKGVKIGRAHWSATIGEELASSHLNTDALPPDGMVRRATGYTLEFDGSVSLDDLSRVRFACSLKLSTNQSWQEFSLKFLLKPESWEIRASNVEQKFKFISEEGTTRNEHEFTFADFNDPEKFARAIGGPLFPAAIAALGFPLKQARPSSLALGLEWEARGDSIRVGRNSIRVYRLAARLFDRFQATLFVSPVGEILRVELPDDVILTNEALSSL